LIADDDEKLRQVVQRAATAMGFEMVEAANGAELDARMREQRPDLIILDIEFPGDDGRDMLARLKSDKQTASIPILVWSGRDPMYARRTAFSLGADEYLEKGSAQGLLALVERMLPLAPE
jgi:CheY-like chemotaxis protein